FSAEMGMPLSQYLRGRRLSEAARELARGAPDILAVALEAGYSSHEAFTRAFRDQFGVTPTALRSARDLDQLTLVAPTRRDRPLAGAPPRPRIARLGPLLLAGLAARFSMTDLAGIPALWQRFQPHIGHVPGQRSARVTYGVCMSAF